MLNNLLQRRVWQRNRQSMVIRTKKTSRKKGNIGNEKGNALKMAIQQIEASYGRGALMQLGSTDINTSVETISSGSLSLDIALGTGGLPRGRVVEIYGPESSGKTTLALHCIAEAQKQGGTCAFVDAEHAIDPQYAKLLGVNINDLYVSQPDSGEQALEITDTLVRSGALDVIVVDSVAALVPRAELEGEMGDAHIALQARLMSQALRKLTASLNRSNCMLIFINQIRQKVGIIFGSPEVTAGGTALKYYASVRLDIRRKTQLKETDKVIGNEVAVKVVKNKLAPPFRIANFDMIYGEGIDRNSELLELGAQVGCVKRSGAWYAYIKDPEKDISEPMGQGKNKAKIFLRENPEISQEIEKTIRQHFLAPKEAEEEAMDVAEGILDIEADVPSIDEVETKREL